MLSRVPLAVGLLLPTTLARAETTATPSWLKADAAAKTAEFDVVAAFNENNSNWNFNGYHTGNATVPVPVGWTVQIPYRNLETDVPHSLVVMTDTGSEDDFPSEVGEAGAVFPGAHSKSPVEGTATEVDESFSFTADKAGDYLWYCGVPGHGAAGMWIRFRVTDEVDAPAVTLADDAEPGRE